jgi:hypothetical protein
MFRSVARKLYLYLYTYIADIMKQIMAYVTVNNLPHRKVPVRNTYCTNRDNGLIVIVFASEAVV